jgi:hypothetical protein
MKISSLIRHLQYLAAGNSIELKRPDRKIRPFALLVRVAIAVAGIRIILSGLITFVVAAVVIFAIFLKGSIRAVFDALSVLRLTERRNRTNRSHRWNCAGILGFVSLLVSARIRALLSTSGPRNKR